MAYTLPWTVAQRLVKPSMRSSKPASSTQSPRSQLHFASSHVRCLDVNNRCTITSIAQSGSVLRRQRRHLRSPLRIHPCHPREVAELLSAFLQSASMPSLAFSSWHSLVIGVGKPGSGALKQLAMPKLMQALSLVLHLRQAQLLTASSTKFRSCHEFKSLQENEFR